MDTTGTADAAQTTTAMNAAIGMAAASSADIAAVTTSASSVTQDDSDSETDAETESANAADAATARHTAIGTASGITSDRTIDITGTADAAQTTTATNAAIDMAAASSSSADIAVATSATDIPIAAQVPPNLKAPAHSVAQIRAPSLLVDPPPLNKTTDTKLDNGMTLDSNLKVPSPPPPLNQTQHPPKATVSNVAQNQAPTLVPPPLNKTTDTKLDTGMILGSNFKVRSSSFPLAPAHSVAHNQAPTLVPPPLNKTAGRQNSSGKPSIVVLGTTGMRLQLFSNFMDSVGIVKSVRPADEDGLLKLNQKELISLLKENADSGPNSALILDYINKKHPSARANIDWKQIAVAAITQYQFSWVMLPVVAPLKKGDSARYGISVGELTELLDVFGPGKASIVATGVIGPDVSSYIPLARSDLENEEELNGAGYSHVKKNLLESVNYFGIAYLVFGGKQYDGRSFFSKVIHHSAAGYFTIAGFFIPEHQIEEEGKHAYNAEALYKASHGSYLHINGMKFGQSTLNAYHFKAFENQSQSAGGVELLEYFGENNCCYFR
jgi:hypothetical protein